MGEEWELNVNGWASLSSRAVYGRCLNARALFGTGTGSYRMTLQQSTILPFRLLPFPMLPSRLLRSVRPLPRLVSHRLAAKWRPSSSLIRPGPRFYSDSVTTAPPTAQHLPQNTSDSAKTQQSDEPKYSLTFTCKVPECDERTSHMFSKRAYHHGIVIIQCPKCKNRYVVLHNKQLPLHAF